MNKKKNKKKNKNNPFFRPFVAGLSLLSLSFPLVAGEENSETRGFVISMIHTATYYDDRTCPEGTNGSRPDVLIRRVMGDGYDREEAIRIVSSPVSYTHLTLPTICSV